VYVATTRKRPGESAVGSAGGIRHSAARLGLSAREARTLVRLANAPGDGAELTTTLGDLLVEHSLEHGWARTGIRQLLEDVAEAAEVEAGALGTRVLGRTARNPSLLALSPHLAIEMHVRMLHALAPVDDVSLWSSGAGEGLTCLAYAGRTEPTRRARLAARDVLEGRPPAVGLVRTLPVERWQRVEAALVFRVGRGSEKRALSAAGETAGALTPILERDALLSRNASRERALVASGERLLTRIGFDLHDGPIQDLAALAGDVRMLRTRAEEHGEPISEDILCGFLDDLQARIGAIDRSLRDAVHSLESPAVARRPLDEALEREVEAFRLQSDIVVDLSLRGRFEALTASQRIALVRIVQESLSNARDHSGAQSVSVSVAAGSNGTTLEISDDGRGFDVPRTLVRAARRGRFGLLGMSERVRLLGGRFDVQSRSGGPTTVSVHLPVWKPAVEAPAAEPLAVES
jgi:signal transduction histidine kinase